MGIAFHNKLRAQDAEEDGELINFLLHFTRSFLSPLPPLIRIHQRLSHFHKINCFYAERRAAG